MTMLMIWKIDRTAQHSEIILDFKLSPCSEAPSVNMGQSVPKRRHKIQKPMNLPKEKIQNAALNLGII